MSAENAVRRKLVVDFHTHPYRGPGEYMGVYAEDFYLPPEEMAEDLARAGIAVFCGSVLEAGGPVQEMPDFARIRRLNDAALALRERLGDRYVPGFHIHPAFPKESVWELERMRENDVRLLGELVPYLHGWAEAGHDYASAGLSEILDAAEDLGAVVSFHTMPEWAAQTERMVASHPGLVFVAAHPGQREDFQLHVKRMQKFPNLYLDLSGTGLFRYGLLVAGVRAVGADRILFGTDFPICNPRMYVQAVLGEHITEAEKERILYENARRLLFTS